MDVRNILPNFKKSAFKANSILKTKGITLNFSGYDDVIIKYATMLEEDIYTNKHLAIELNLWTNYIQEIISVVSYCKDMLIDELDYLKAYKDRKNKNEELIKKIKEKESEIKTLKKFIKLLESQRNFFIKSFYHVKNVYNSSNKKLNYNYYEI